MKQLDLIPDQAITGSGVSDRVPLFSRQTFSVQFKWTGTLLGTVSLEESVDGTTWGPMAGSSQSTASVPGSHLISYSLAGFPFFRAKYVHISGTGNLSAVATIKDM